MNRRTFLQSLAAAIGLGPIVAKVKPTVAVIPPMPPKSTLELEIERSWLKLRAAYERELLNDPQWLSSHES